MLLSEYWIKRYNPTMFGIPTLKSYVFQTVRETNHSPSIVPSHRESRSLWSRSSQSQSVPAATPVPAPVPVPVPAPAPAVAPTGGSIPNHNHLSYHYDDLICLLCLFLSAFSRMASISSLFRSHRRGTTPATPATSANNTLHVEENPGKN